MKPVFSSHLLLADDVSTTNFQGQKTCSFGGEGVGDMEGACRASRRATEGELRTVLDYC